MGRGWPGLGGLLESQQEDMYAATSAVVMLEEVIPETVERRAYPAFGCNVVDHKAWSSTSFNVTAMASVAPSIATWPKN
jgi:hypothetical protein